MGRLQMQAVVEVQAVFRGHYRPPVRWMLPAARWIDSFHTSPEWWQMAYRMAWAPWKYREEPPCPHCQYFGGEEHHPSCPRTMHYTAHPDGTVTEAGFACEVCGVPAGVACDGGLHG